MFPSTGAATAVNAALGTDVTHAFSDQAIAKVPASGGMLCISIYAAGSKPFDTM